MERITMYTKKVKEKRESFLSVLSNYKRDCSMLWFSRGAQPQKAQSLKPTTYVFTHSSFNASIHPSFHPKLQRSLPYTNLPQSNPPMPNIKKPTMKSSLLILPSCENSSTHISRVVNFLFFRTPSLPVFSSLPPPSATSSEPKQPTTPSIFIPHLPSFNLFLCCSLCCFLFSLILVEADWNMEGKKDTGSNKARRKEIQAQEFLMMTRYSQ